MLNSMRQFIENHIIKTLANDHKIPEQGCRFFNEDKGKYQSISMRPFVRWLNKGMIIYSCIPQ